MIPLSTSLATIVKRVFILAICLSLVATRVESAVPLEGTELNELKRSNSWAVKGCGVLSNATAPTPGVDIGEIVKKYNLQSAIVLKINGDTIAEHNSNQPPNTPASTLKLIIADTLMQSGASLGRDVRVSRDVYYDGSNDLGVSNINLGSAMERMLSSSSNVGANVIIKELGGPGAFTSKANSSGYKDTVVKAYYDPANSGKNISTIQDQAKAMANIFNSSGSGYTSAQSALSAAAKNDNQYNVADSANKWAGTSDVAGNVGKFNTDSDGVIVGVYINQSMGAAGVAENIKNASEELAKVTGNAPSAASTSQCACTAQTGSFSGSISPGVGNGLTPKGKESLQKAVIAASEKHGTDPNFVASFYYTENSRTDDSTNNADSAGSPPVTGDGKWREPPAPFGSGSAWPAMNAYTAFGPFQFITSTWQAYKPPGTNDTSDRNDLNIAAEAAAKYLAALGGKQGADEAALRKAAWGYNHSDTYVQSVINTYKHLSSGGSTDVSGGDTCVDTDGGGGFQAISGDRAEIVKKILDSTKLKLGNYGNASTQRTDIQNELSDDALMVLAAAVTQSGVNIPINALKSDHGPRGAHGQGNAIDIGYYGNGDSRHTSQGDKLYKFLYNNREKLNIDQMIWKNPPKGYKCLFGGKPADCLASYGQGTMNQHYHHIHVGV